MDRTEIDDRLEKFEKAPRMIKARLLTMADMQEEAFARNRSILDTMYKEGRGHSVVAVIGDYAVIEETKEPRSFDNSPYTFAIRRDGKWIHSSHYVATIEDAILHAIGYLADGANSSYGSMCAAMLRGLKSA
jgi:hypothetical protein